MSWMQTYTGKKFHFNSFVASDICLKDIAHALAYTCRFGGHSHIYYSVAEHSMHIADYFYNQGEKELAKQALLHDATEAYIGDMVRPLKHMMPAFSEYEDTLADVILTKYGLPASLDLKIKEADSRILINEKNRVFPAHLQLLWGVEESLRPLPNVDIKGWEAEVAYDLFLEVLQDEFGYDN